MKVIKSILLSLLMFSAGFSFAQKPEFSFKDDTYKFDKTEEGALLSFSYEFTNSGDAPLIISDYKVNCNCTVVKYPKEPILPGKSAKITVEFDTKGKIGFQKRTITLISNAGEAELTFKGVVKASEETIQEYKESH